MIKIAALLLAVLIAAGITPVLTVTNAQNETNATSTTNTTTTETNTTIPITEGPGGEFPAQLPVFPETEAPEAIGGDNQTNQTQPEAQPQPNDNVTQADTLLDEAQIKIDEARQLIASLRAQLEQANRPIQDKPINQTEEIIESGNESAEEIIDIIDEEATSEPNATNEVGNVTDDIVDTIEDSINSEDNATGEIIENVTDEVIEVIDNATENLDNSTTEVALDNAMIRLLSNLVAAQNFNVNLAQEERDELQANLQDAISELASDAADALR